MRKTLTLTLLLLLAGTLLLNPAWAWHIERPWRSSDDDYSLPSRVENCHTDGTASAGLGVNPHHFSDKGTSDYNADFISLNVTMTANSRKHIAYTYTEESLFWIEYDSGRDTRLVGVGDDEGFEVDLTPPDSSDWVFRFWGGAGEFLVTNGSAEYRSVWICTNGFLSFGGTNSTSRTPTDIPNPQAPNAIIAAVWSDLWVDSDTSIFYGWRQFGVGFSDWSFFVTWNNTLHKDTNNRLTFQIVLLEDAPGYYGNPYIAWGQS